MAQARREACLVEEHLDELPLVRQLGKNALDDHQLLEPGQAELSGEKDLGHTAHRDPVQALASNCSLSALLRRGTAEAVDVAIAADAETTLPLLIEYVKQAIPADRRSVIAARGEKAKKAQAQARDRMLQAAAGNAWDATPISSSRFSAEIWNQIKNENWALVSRDSSPSNWPHRLWTFDQHHQFIGGPGGAGIGYGLPAAVGASFAHRSIDKSRLCINIQNDGDSMYAPGALWTASHHNLPMLTIMWNNRAYHQEIMHLQRMANWRQRDVTTAHIGTTIQNPFVQYEKLAEALGQVGIGPITDPKDLGPAIRRGIDAVKGGEPVLINVVTQPR